MNRPKPSAPPEPPPFPADLRPLLDDPGLCDSARLHNLGLLYRLTLAAWHQRPPCTLPHEAAALAALAGVERTADKSSAWFESAIEFFCDHGWAVDDTSGRIVLPAARKLYDSLVLEADTRRQRTAAASKARWRGGGNPSVTESVTENLSVTDSVTHPVPHCVLSFSGTPQRFPIRAQKTTPERRAPSAEQVEFKAEGVLAEIGPGTAEAIIQGEARAFVKHLLETSRWPWAGSPTQRYMPARLVRELTFHEHSTPERVAYVLREIELRHEDAINPGSKKRDYTAPIGVVIAALGAQINMLAPQPWPIPVTFRAEFLHMFQQWRRGRAAAAAFPHGLAIGPAQTPSAASSKESSA